VYHKSYLAVLEIGEKYEQLEENCFFFMAGQP